MQIRETAAAADLRVAETIAEQIGGPALYMIGARNLVGSGPEADHRGRLSFKVGRNARKVTHVRITLEPTDLYTLEFLRVPSLRARDLTPETLSTVEGVYFDQLRPVIERETGLRTHL